MRFKMNKLTAAVAVTLGTSAVVISTAQADELLFPYLVSSATVTTLVTTINNADITNRAVLNVEQLHYRYWYKNGANATNNAATCAEVNRPFPSSPNDIVTFDAAGQFGADNLGILFEDTSVSRLPNGANRGYGNASFALLRGLTQPVRAFLIVDNNDAVNAGNVILSTTNSLAGEATILEFQTGAAWGYQAYNPGSRGDPGFRTNAYDFSDFSEMAGEVIAGELQEGATPVALAPFTATGGEFRTKFFVTPIAPSRPLAAAPWWTVPDQRQGNLNARVRLVIEDWDLGFAAIYDRDESPVSGQAPQNVACVGAVEATAMLTEGALLQVPDGGWSNLVVSEGTLNATVPANVDGTRPFAPTSEAIVIKLEYNEQAPLALDDNATSPVINGITNNAIWLRKGIKESIPSPAAPGGVRFALWSVYERNPDGSLRLDANGNPILSESNVVSSGED